MDVGSTLVSHAQSTELVQPAERAFNHPACGAQAAAVEFATKRDQGSNAVGLEPASVGLATVARIALHRFGSPPGMAASTAYRRNGVHQRGQQDAIEAIGAAEHRGQGNAIGIGDEAVFGAGFSTIHGAGAGQFAPPTARIEALSTTARDQSIFSAACR